MASLTRKFLTALGVEEEKIDEIIEAHRSVVNEIKDERDKYREAAEQLPEVQKKLDELEAIDNGDSTWQKKYEDEHSAFEAYKTEQTAKEMDNAKASAYKQLLKDAGISEKRLDSIMRITDISGIEIVDGKIKGADKLTEKVKEEWSDFIIKSNQHGANTQNPPNNNGGAKDYEDMSMEEYISARKGK